MSAMDTGRTEDRVTALERRVADQADNIDTLEDRLAALTRTVDRHGLTIGNLELNLGNTTNALGRVEAAADELADRLDKLEANLADELAAAAVRRTLTGGQP